MRQQARNAGTTGEGALWRFALAVYAEPGVKAECLHFQDRQKGDVCLLLAALFLAARGIGVESGALGRLERAVPWPARLHLRLARGLRKRLPRDGGAGRLRKALLAHELSLERARLARLEAALAPECAGRGDIGPDAALRLLADNLADFYRLDRLHLPATFAAAGRIRARPRGR